VPLARDRQPFKGCLGVALRASQSDRNNILYIAPLLLAISPQLLLFYSRRLLRVSLGRGLERYWLTNIYNLAI